MCRRADTGRSGGTCRRWSDHNRQILLRPVRAIGSAPAARLARRGPSPAAGRECCSGRTSSSRSEPWSSNSGPSRGAWSATRGRSEGGTAPTSCSCRPPPRIQARSAAALRRVLPRRAAMRVAAYARVSTQRQAQAQTTEQQLERLRAHAATRGWALPSECIFRDDGCSGAALRRPGLDRLRDAAAGARLDRILITAPDRLARNYVHQVLLVEELQKHGAEVEFLDRPMSRDPHDQLLLQIRGAVAEYERTLITERMRRGRLRRLRAGTLLPWTRPPYGYRLSPDRPRDPASVRLDEGGAATARYTFTRAETEAATVRNIFTWYVEDGLPLTAMVRRLSRLGIVSPKGKALWATSALRGLLTNPTYVGEVYANRTRATPSARRQSALHPVGKTGTTNLLTARGDWIAVADVPAIVTRGQFYAAQERLTRNRQLASRNNTVHPYLLRGLVSCGYCRRGCSGRDMAPAHDYYLCRTKIAMRELVGEERCHARYIPARALEALVWGDLCTVLANPDMIAEALERARNGHWLPQELQARKMTLRQGHASVA